MITAIIAASRRRYRAAVLGDGALALWRFGDNTNDETGSYNGTAVGSPTYVDGATQDGNKAITTAAGKYVSLPISAGIKPAFPFTIEAWVNLPTSAVANAIISTDQFDSIKYAGCLIAVSSTGISCQLGNGGATGSTSRKTYIALVDTPNATWTHLAFVCDSISDVKIYHNAVDIATTSSGTAATIAYTSTQGRIGARTDGTEPFIGSLDEVAFYPTALSAARILAHYNAR